MSNQDPSTKSLNILMLAPTMFFADYGAHVRILEETRILQKRGHRVTILAYPNGRDIDGIEVRRCWGVPFNYRVIVGSSRHKIYLDVLLAVMALWYVLWHRPDIIHAHLHEGSLIGWILSKLTGVPLVFDFQGSLTSEMADHNFLSARSPFYRLLYWLETRIDHAADVILTSSTHAANLLVETFGVPTERVLAMPDCVDADNFCANNYAPAEVQDLKQSLAIPANKKVIAYLGVLTPYQGIDKLLEALALLKESRHDFHLLLMGYPGVLRYQEMAQQLGLAEQVTFTGKIPYQDACRYLAAGDIAVAPKISATEGSGKILNYMAMNLPTVAFNMPVSREFLGDGGIYAQEVDSKALAAALNRVLDLCPAERVTLGGYLRRRVVKNFSWDHTGEQIEAVYRALLAGEPLPASPVKSISRQLSENL